MTIASSSSLDSILFPISTFLLSIYTLSTSTSTFITSTARLAHHLHVDETLISLLTAGAEWEELAVIVAALAQHRPNLALGNILGSCVANVLGAFSLGVLAQREAFVRYDGSARIYAGVSFAVTSGVAGLWALGLLQRRAYGILLTVVFVGYMLGIAWSIYRGVLDAPEDSDAESDGDLDSDCDDGPLGGSVEQDGTQHDGNEAGESTPLTGRRRRRSILSTLVKLLVAFAALSISGYVLSHSSQALASNFGISETVFGATLLSLGTTLPEKFVAVVAGYRGHPGIMVANTVGSNIFLLTLCLGVTITSSQNLADGSNYTNEILWTWAASAFLMATIVVGTHRLVGLVMLLAYVAFFALELAVYKP